MTETKMTFEAALAKLEASADALKKEGTTLEDAMQYFEDGLKYYNACSEILADAKQKIQIYDQSAKILKEMI